MILTIKRRKKSRLLIYPKTALLILTLSLAACSTAKAPPPPSFDLVQQQGIPASHIIKDVPLVIQEEHYCGPASLAMVFQYHGKKLTQEEAAAMVYTPGREGTFQHDMVTAMHRNGFMAIKLDSIDQIIKELHAGNPIIVFQNLALSWAPQWHYAVVTGYDFQRNGFYMHSGKNKNHFVPFNTFAKTWNRAGSWAYVASPPEKLPASADLQKLIDAIVALEKTGQQQAALTGYRTVSNNYPQSHKSWFGAANIMMADKKYHDAEEAYKHSLMLKPTLFAYNNLAYALHKQGKNKQACTILDEAIEAAPTLEDTARKNEFKGVLYDTKNELCQSS